MENFEILHNLNTVPVHTPNYMEIGQKHLVKVVFTDIHSTNVILPASRSRSQ